MIVERIPDIETYEPQYLLPEYLLPESLLPDGESEARRSAANLKKSGFAEVLSTDLRRADATVFPTNKKAGGLAGAPVVSTTRQSNEEQ